MRRHEEMRGVRSLELNVEKGRFCACSLICQKSMHIKKRAHAPLNACPLSAMLTYARVWRINLCYVDWMCAKLTEEFGCASSNSHRDLLILTPFQLI